MWNFIHGPESTKKIGIFATLFIFLFHIIIGLWNQYSASSTETTLVFSYKQVLFDWLCFNVWKDILVETQIGGKITILVIYSLFSAESASDTFFPFTLKTSLCERIISFLIFMFGETEVIGLGMLCDFNIVS